MKIFGGIAVVLSGLGVSGCHNASGEDQPAPVAISKTPPKTEATADLTATFQALDNKGDWKGLLQAGRNWQKAHPGESKAYFAQARAAYMLGDVETSIQGWEKLFALHPASKRQGEGWLNTTRSVRRNFPGLKLRPIEWLQGEASREQDEWQAKAAALLGAKKYDEIEKIAAQLQKSNASNAKGTPYLAFWLGGLSGGAESVSSQQNRVAAWRAARPRSDLARLAEIKMWTDTGWRARGDGYASTITPAMRAKIDAALAQSSQRLKNLPPSAFQSPLAFVVALDAGLLSGAPRQYLDQIFQAGTRRFPNYLPLYRTRAIHLLPRWFGAPGEALTMIEARAAQIGGAEGEIFYARVMWHLEQVTGGLSKDFHYDYQRAARGLEVLQKRHPTSISVQGARLALAFENRDWKRAQQVLSSPTGHRLDTAWTLWGNTKAQISFAQQRMLILGAKVP